MGGEGSDILIGGNGKDKLEAGKGNTSTDVLIGDGFQLTGLSIDDLFSALHGYSKTKTLNFTLQLVPLAGDSDELIGGDGSLLAIGGGGADKISGGKGTNLVLGDSLRSNSSSGSFSAGKISESLAEAIGVVRNLLKTIQLDQDGDDEIDCSQGTANVILGGGGGDRITGGGGALDVLLGNDGDDQIDGKQGFNFIVGGLGNDRLQGGDSGNVIIGDDLKLQHFALDVDALLKLQVWKAISTLRFELTIEGNGDDVIHGGNGFDFLVGGFGDDEIYGQNGLNIVFGDLPRMQVGGIGSLVVNFGSWAKDIASAIATPDPIGKFKALVKIAESIWEALNGLFESDVENMDTYIGGNDTDIVFGGEGNDFLYGMGGVDLLVGGRGNDWLSAGGDPLHPDGFFKDWAFGGPGNDFFEGGPGRDFLGSTGGDDVFFGFDGDDFITGGIGDDLLFAGSGNNSVRSSSGNDLIEGTTDDHDAELSDFLIDGETLWVNSLEDNSTENDDKLTLREAILEANSRPGTNLVRFAPDLTASLAQGEFADIVLSGSMPIISKKLFVLGDLQGRIRIDANGLSQVFLVEQNVPFRLHSLEIFGYQDAFDFGDAPASYGVLSADNGPRHRIVDQGPRLGKRIDPEREGSHNEGAYGDDQRFLASDEDGLYFTSPLVLGATGAIIVETTGDAGFLDAWIDWNGNGFFDHPEEWLTGDSIGMLAGLNVVPLNIPNDAKLGEVFLRLRVSSMGGLTPLGSAEDGEIEDHRLFILPDNQENDIEWTLLDGSSSWLAEETRYKWEFEGKTIFDIPAQSVRELRAVGQENGAKLHWYGQDRKLTVDGSLGGVTLFGDGMGELIDFSNTSALHQRNIHSVDLRGASKNQLLLSHQAVSQLLDGAGTLTVYLDASDSLDPGSGWKLLDPGLYRGSFVRVLGHEDLRIAVHGPSDWQNPLSKLDVDSSGSIVPLDALLIINELNMPKYLDSRPALRNAADLETFPAYFDTSGDYKLTPLDVLLVINHLNRRGGGEGEHPSIDSISVVPEESEQMVVSTSSRFNVMQYWWDDSEDTRRNKRKQ